jgi:hypothetical protein
MRKPRASNRTLFLALAVALSGVALSRDALAEETKEAIEHFERGVALYKASSFEAALVEFDEVYRLSGNYRLLFNIGLCRMETKDDVGAIEAFKRYLLEGGDQIDKAKREEVNEQLQKLQMSVTRITLNTNATAGAEVLVDDQKVATLPLSAPLVVKVGKRRISVAQAGRLATKTLVITGGENAPIELMLTGTATTAASSALSTPVLSRAATDPAASRRGFPWVPWVITGALGGGAVVTGILAVGARNEATKAQATFGARTGDIEPKQNRANTFGIVTDVLLGATLVSAGVATYLTLRAGGGASKPSTARRSELHIGPTGAFVSGSF